MTTRLLDGPVADRQRSEPVKRSRNVWPSDPAATLWGTMVGKKVVMAVTGILLVGFVVYPLLHLTAGVVGFQPGEFRDLSVYDNVVAGFSVWYVSLFYIVAMACLCLHLDHGVWSLLQTLGWNNARVTPALQALSRGVALVVFFGFISVPVAVLAGWVR